MSTTRAFILTFVVCVAFRGAFDILVRKSIPWPSLFGTDDARLREEDIVNRRRAWTWGFLFRLARTVIILITIIWALKYVTSPVGDKPTWIGMLGDIFSKAGHAVPVPGVLDADRRRLLPLPRELPDLHGPAADDGHLADPRLRARRRAVGREARRRARPDRGQGGDPARRNAVAVGRDVRERRRQARARPDLPRRPRYRQDDDGEGDRHGLQLAVRLDPGLGLRATFIGIDAIIVRFLARKAKKLARKWGGQCIVFIDEIDAVGMRRSALGRQIDDARLLRNGRSSTAPGERATRAAT